MICLVSLAEVKAVTHNPQTYDQFVTKNQLMQSIYPLLVDMGYSSHGTIEAIMRYIMSEEIVDITDLYRAGVKQPDINNIVNIRTQFSAGERQGPRAARSRRGRDAAPRAADAHAANGRARTAVLLRHRRTGACAAQLPPNQAMNSNVSRPLAKPSPIPSRRAQIHTVAGLPSCMS